jgi:L-serine dehydratase
MEISIFDVTGPIMIGPSSSHTAGAVRIGNVAKKLAHSPFSQVDFALSGSFAQTGLGHGTDRALVAGVLGMHVSDLRIPQALIIADKQGLVVTFREISLDSFHENSVSITFTLLTGEQWNVIGSSVGGGEILICQVQGFAVEFDAKSPTVLIEHRDVKGIISKITEILAEADINIATLRLSRTSKGMTAWCVLETDSVVSDDVIERIQNVEDVMLVRAITPEEDDD